MHQFHVLVKSNGFDKVFFEVDEKLSCPEQIITLDIIKLFV